MGKIFRPSSRESTILSKIESSKEHERRQAINAVRDRMEPLANAISQRLVDSELVETTSKNTLEEQIRGCYEFAGTKYQGSPETIRNLISTR